MTATVLMLLDRVCAVGQPISPSQEVSSGQVSSVEGDNPAIDPLWRSWNIYFSLNAQTSAQGAALFRGMGLNADQEIALFTYAGEAVTIANEIPWQGWRAICERKEEIHAFDELAVSVESISNRQKQFIRRVLEGISDVIGETDADRLSRRANQSSRKTSFFSTSGLLDKSQPFDPYMARACADLEVMHPQIATQEEFKRLEQGFLEKSRDMRAE